MRILIITAQYYPALNPNVYRWGAIAEYWVEQGHAVHILCTRRSGMDKESERNGVKIHRVGENSLLDWVYNLVGKQQRRGELGSSGGKGSGRMVLEKLVDWTWRKIYWPDGRCLWYFPGRKRAIALIKQEEIDAVVSVGLPFTAHLIGLFCKQYRPELQWLVDIEDPFSIAQESRINNRLLYRRINHRAEKMVLQQADQISVTVAAARLAYARAFPEIAHKISITPPLFSLDRDGGGITSRVFEADKIHLAYFGAFYHRIRTPELLLKVLVATFQGYPEWQEKLVVHLFGEIPPGYARLFENYPQLLQNLKIYGLISREEVAAVTPKIDFLVNIGNRTTYHLPSKTVDYLMSGKPIVNLTYHEQDTFREFLLEYPNLLTLCIKREVSENQVQAFVQFLEEKQGETVSLDLREKLAAPYGLPVVAGGYLELLGSVRSGGVGE